MAAALECWSSRTNTNTEEDAVEQVLMRTHHRSEASLPPPPPSSSSSNSKDSTTTTIPVHKKLQKLSRNLSEAITSFKNSLNLNPNNNNNNNNNHPDSPPSSSNSKKLAWATVLRNLTHLYPGTQLPDNLLSNIRNHYHSLPLSYAQAEFDMKDVFLHIKLMEQALESDQPAILIQQESCDGGGEVQVQGSALRLTFACNSPISWPAVSVALDSFSICCKRSQIFERNGFTLGVVLLVVNSGHDKLVRTRVENALKFAMKKPKSSAVNVKLPFGLCGCQEENFKWRELGENEEDSGGGKEFENSSQKIRLQVPLPTSCFIVSVDEWQTIKSGGDEIEKWLLNADSVEFTEQIGPNSYKGVYMGKRVGIERLKGCEKGNSYEFELHRDLLELMTCGHRNILQLCGICVDDNHGLCVVTKFMEGGSVHDLMLLKNKKLQGKDVVRIAVDVAEGIKFMNDHGVAYRDLNTQRILLDRHGNACLGDMGIVTACKCVGEAMEYETDGYRWLAPEIIAGDPESVTETWMSNVYSYGMVIWEMVTGEAAYSAFSPVQAAVGIAACGLRPEIPKDCHQNLKHIMTKCWNNTPSKRPQFSEILAILLRPNNNR